MIQNVLYFPKEFAEAYPHKTAFVGKHTNLTYHRLSDLSMRIGSVLGQKAGPHRPVPALAEKNVFTPTAFMGIIQADCFYVFPGADQPAECLSRILDTLQADLMTVDKESLSPAGPVSFSGGTLPLENLTSPPDDALSPGPLVFIRRQSTDTDPLYGIFASSSTGVSKGMVASHRSIINSTGRFTDLFHITQDDIIGNQAPFDFDVSVRDIYSALKTGATLEVTLKKLFSVSTGLPDYLCGRKIITAIWAVSALCITTTLKGFTYRASSHLNKILSSGEAILVKHLNTWRNCLSETLFVNLYGPMETTCNCTYYVMDREFKPGTPILVGRPSPNETVFLLDESDRLITEPGQSGELYVAGVTLALGYYRDPRRATMAFVQNPLNFCYSETICRIDDLVCCSRDGLLYFNGRKDLQIKHMGHRIELGEIEAALGTVEDVDRAVCLFLEEKNKTATLYEGTAVRGDITIGLESLLPHCIFPDLYKNLAELPRTENGKMDRQALRRLYG